MGVIIIEIVLAFVFTFAGLTKLFGIKWQIDNYNMLKLPQWFRIVTGWTQIIGVAAIILGIWKVFGRSSGPASGLAS